MSKQIHYVAELFQCFNLQFAMLIDFKNLFAYFNFKLDGLRSACLLLIFNETFLTPPPFQRYQNIENMT